MWCTECLSVNNISDFSWKTFRKNPFQRNPMHLFCFMRSGSVSFYPPHHIISTNFPQCAPVKTNLISKFRLCMQTAKKDSVKLRTENYHHSPVRPRFILNNLLLPWMRDSVSVTQWSDRYNQNSIKTVNAKLVNFDAWMNKMEWNTRETKRNTDISFCSQTKWMWFPLPHHIFAFYSFQQISAEKFFNKFSLNDKRCFRRNSKDGKKNMKILRTV